MKEIFERLACSETQMKLYLTLFRVGPTIASILAKRSGIKRVTVYGALEGLKQKGLVESFEKNHVTYYQACDPEVIMNFLEMKRKGEEEFYQNARKKIQEFHMLRKKGHETIIEVKGVIRYYEGRDAVNQLIQENLNLGHTIQYCIGMSGYHALHFSKNWEQYISKRVQNGMKVLSIQSDTDLGRTYQKKDALELRETRLISSDKCLDQGELNLIGDRIILFTSEGNEAVGVKITHRKIANILKKLFELAWEQAGGAKNKI